MAEFDLDKTAIYAAPERGRQPGQVTIPRREERPIGAAPVTTDGAAFRYVETDRRV